jgi:hypothetical protein
MIFNAKIVFLAVNASLRWRNNVSSVHLVQVFLLPIGQQGLQHFFLLPNGWRIVQILRQRRRKTTNTVPTTLSAIQAQANPLLPMNNCTPLVISWNDKNKQLALLNQLNKIKIKSLTKDKNVNDPKHMYEISGIGFNDFTTS